MVIDELDVSAKYRLSRILGLLENLYQITLDFDAVKRKSDLVSVYEKYEALRHKMIRESHFSSSQNADYMKACMIQEAIYIFLSEIAPTRKNRRQAGSRFKEQTKNEH